LEPENVAAASGLGNVLIELGRIDDAKSIFDSIPSEKSSDARVIKLKAALELALQANDLGDMTELENRLTRNSDDHEARFELALALNAKGARQAAADSLLTIIRKQRDWQEGKARQQLLQFFEAWGPLDQDTIDARRKLSTLLFS
jgi:putative thioredoxin